MRHHLPVRRVHHAHQAEDGRAAGVHQRRAVLDNQSSTALTMRPDRWPLGLLGQSTNIKKKIISIHAQTFYGADRALPKNHERPDRC